jgi:eukaryotic-like serine/threonine-protein kinase
MGEVYRARDLKLGRDVAIKTLPAAFTSDPERVARFQREAQVLAALNHPSIAQIYCVEDASTETGAAVRALVMELVDGETLADRITRGPIPLDEALPIARQIAEALEAAHEQGIVHRDLKPANIKVRGDGTVKVLDFGLAKLAAPAAMGHAASASLSPTITSPALMTGAGMLLGTAAYMSPEQAKGREADKRSDIWAFGCVLFEILTGRRAFAGEALTDTLANVLTAEPPWSALSSATPLAVHRLLRRSLEKDSRERLQHIGDARIELRDARAAEVDPSGSGSLPPKHRAMQRLLAAAAVLAGAAALGAVWLAMRQDAPGVSRLVVLPPPAASPIIDFGVALTPDGTRIIYVGGVPQKLFVRALDHLESVPLVASGLPRSPFVSPDGQWVGFFDAADRLLKKVAITGGPPMRVCGPLGQPRGFDWSSDGESIVFSDMAGLARVSAEGGEPVVLTQLRRERGEGAHVTPSFLPDDRSVLFTIAGRAGAGGISDSAEIAVLDLRSGMQKILLRGGNDARYVPTGHLIYATSGGIRAVPFDRGRLRVTGPSVPILSDVAVNVTGAQLDVAGDGRSFI